MERWNELIAGHVMGNLTDEEHQELSTVLREHPRLRLEILRLQKTATMGHAQKVDYAGKKLSAGAEGWTDTAENLPQSPSVQLVFPEHEQLVAAVVDSANAEPGKRLIAAADGERSVPPRLGSPIEAFFQRTSLLGWLMALILVGIGIDNWRVRQLLAIAQEQILQLELSVEYISDSPE